MSVIKSIVSLFTLLTLVSCANVYQDMDPPKVSVDSFRALPSDGAAPRFEIKLRVINPNTTALDIAGVSYSIALLDRELITGVTNDVPLIEGYSEEVVTLEAGIQLFELLRLFTTLGAAADEPLQYRFSAKIDFKGLLPTQRVEDTGVINLQP
ncbi:MAG: LEA type 2 family protein [Gammaproteobacteria bacterium]|nr:LEA type 2 family protein [Gammaproteobacteria bacterium]